MTTHFATHPAVRDRVADTIQAEDELVRDALERLGMPMPNPAASLEQPTAAPTVRLGERMAFDGDPTTQWTVIGTDSRDVKLARRADGGAVESARRSWSELVRPGAPAGFDSNLVSQLAASTPVATMPANHADAMALRLLLGDRRFVVSDAGGLAGDRQRLIGTGSLPGLGGVQLDELDNAEHWYRQVAGLDLIGSRDTAIVTTDSRRHLADATALFRFRTRTAELYEGYRSDALQAALIEQLADEARESTRSHASILAAHRTAVQTHEAGHIAMDRQWGGLSKPITPQVVDAMRVHEAFADLFAAARTEQPSVGVRDLTELDPRWSTLDALRDAEDQLARTNGIENVDPHRGTQLLTKPMVQVLDDIGGEALGDVVGTAVKSIARGGMHGGVARPGMSSAARALLEATAKHPRANRALVQGLEDAWRALRVLR